MRALRGLLGSLLLFGSLLFGQSPDRHLTSDSARPLYEKSAYAHGYIHGYEEGFHAADMDIHMGRGERPLTVLKEYRNSDGGYHQEFGDKGFFRLGYKQGFREGYSDSISGGQFRAIGETGKASEGLTDSPGARPAGRDFDKSFARGYDAGRERGTNSSNQSPDFEYAANNCQVQNPSRHGKRSQDCDAFVRGFTLGFSDGVASRVQRRTQTAQKSGSQ